MMMMLPPHSYVLHYSITTIHLVIYYSNCLQEFSTCQFVNTIIPFKLLTNIYIYPTINTIYRISQHLLYRENIEHFSYTQAAQDTVKDIN